MPLVLRLTVMFASTWSATRDFLATLLGTLPVKVLLKLVHLTSRSGWLTLPDNSKTGGTTHLFRMTVKVSFWPALVFSVLARQVKPVQKVPRCRAQGKTALLPYPGRRAPSVPWQEPAPVRLACLAEWWSRTPGALEPVPSVF